MSTVTRQSDKSMLVKRISVIALFTVSVLIVASGILFGAYSFLEGISYKVLNTDVPGFIFGLVAVYLGTRYFISVTKLSKNLKNSSDPFDWNNFTIWKPKFIGRNR